MIKYSCKLFPDAYKVGVFSRLFLWNWFVHWNEQLAVAVSFSNLNRKTVPKNSFMYRLDRSKERMLGQSTSVCTVKIDKQTGKAYWWLDSWQCIESNASYIARNISYLLHWSSYWSLHWLLYWFGI